jgi:hypothetical protein
MDTYNVGNGSQQISLTADIDTRGLAASRAIVVDLNSTAAGKPVAHSIDATGDISLKQIGSAFSLKGKRLSVFTKIDLLGDDKDTRKKEYERLGGTYTVSGGPDGSQAFTNPTKTLIDENYLSLFVNQLIDLI